MNDKVEQLRNELVEAQEKRAQHWNKFRLSQITEKSLREFAKKHIQDELHFSNSINFIVQCMLKYNSKHKLKAEETVFLFLNLYYDFLGNKYKLNTEDEIIKLIVNNISEQKIQRVVLTTILKNNLLKRRQEKYVNTIKELKLFIEQEREKLLEKNKLLDNIDSYAYKLFLSEKKEDIIKKKFILKPTKKLKVAVILDEFSFNCFKDEFEAIIITPQDWKEKFDNEQPDLFFCESAWSGSDSIQRPWKGKIYTSINWKHENRKELLEILSFCKERDIPSIFWNKEDPSHYTDRVHDFVKTATLFDFIFTTAEECVESYRKEYGVKNVHALPFATSPKMFNPIEDNERRDNIIFAGSWYANHIQRSKDMENILDTILQSHELKIVDRYYGSGDELHIYPEKYNEYINPGIPFIEMPVLYKESNMALTFNTVKNSKTMFARRAFELMSSNTLVLSNSSDGMSHLLDGLFLDIEKDPDALQNNSLEELGEIRSKALDYVLKNHTYRHRWNYILEKINYKTINDHNTVTIVVLISNEDEIKNIVNNFKSENKDTKLLLILDRSIEELSVQKYILKYNAGYVNLVAQHYLDKYGFGQGIIETTHFFLIDKNTENFSKLSEKLLVHSYYLDNHYVVFDNTFKYKIKKGFIVNNIFSKKEKFSKILNSFNAYIDEDVYCLDDNYLETN